MTETKKAKGDDKELGRTFRENLEVDPATRDTVLADETGQVSNRVEGTIQSEPTPEEMPSDAKIAPLAEQLNPNGAAQAVGALPKEFAEAVTGIDQPDEGEKRLKPDMSDANDFLPAKSKQGPIADRANDKAKQDQTDGVV